MYKKAKRVGNSQYRKYISGIYPRLELNLIYNSKINVKGLGLGPDFRVELTDLA